LIFIIYSNTVSNLMNYQDHLWQLARHPLNRIVIYCVCVCVCVYVCVSVCVCVCVCVRARHNDAFYERFPHEFKQPVLTLKIQNTAQSCFFDASSLPRGFPLNMHKLTHTLPISTSHVSAPFFWQPAAHSARLPPENTNSVHTCSTILYLSRTSSFLLAACRAHCRACP